MERVAIIDIGTNTFNLLVVDRSHNDFEIVYKERIGVGLGNKGLINATIKPFAFERGLNTLKQFKSRCSELNVKSIRGIGTSAIRNASNKTLFIEAVNKHTGIKIEVITGKDEANYIYNGVTLKRPIKESSIIMDIGGGSTEFIFAKQEKIQSKRSFDIGVSRIFQTFDLPEQFDESTIKLIENYLEEEIQDYFNGMNIHTLVGSSGSFKTFYELYANSKYPRNEYIEISIPDIKATLEKTIYSTRKERDENHFIIPIRKKMINIAAVKTNWLINKLDINSFIVSPYSLKEGLIFS